MNFREEKSVQRNYVPGINLEWRRNAKDIARAGKMASKFTIIPIHTRYLMDELTRWFPPRKASLHPRLSLGFSALNTLRLNPRPFSYPSTVALISSTG
ncbi:MAG: hypothetical protein K0Q55_4180 [Verrucomicrobia bacterium]|nr:hypothetical protein [Verrucomicrobiota bacterium]